MYDQKHFIATIIIWKSPSSLTDWIIDSRIHGSSNHPICLFILGWQSLTVPSIMDSFLHPSIHQFINFSFIKSFKDPVFKHPEVKHSFADQEENVWQQFPTYFVTFQALWNRSTYMFGRLHSLQTIDNTVPWWWLKASENSHGIYADTFHFLKTFSKQKKLEQI